MRKTIAALVLALCCLSFGASAATTTLTTTVPAAEHTLRLDIGAGGSVNGKRGEAEMTVEHGQDLALTIAADAGYGLRSVSYNGTDVTALVCDGQLVLKAVESDGELVVRFARHGLHNPQTGDTAQPLLWAATATLGGAGVYILRRRRGGDGA